MNHAPGQDGEAKVCQSTDQDKQSQPRAFAQGTGVLLQTVGMILFLSNCCICSLAGMWDPLLSRSQILDHLQQEQPLGLSVGTLAEQPAKAGIMLMVMCFTVGGLAMAGFGLGLQAEKPGAAWSALTSSMLMGVVLIVAGIGIWAGQASWIVRMWHAMATVIVITLMGFTWVALRQVLAHPPPRGADILPRDFKIPYSHYHDDPPDVRLARQVAERRMRLEAEQRELEKLEQELKNQHTD